MIQKLRLAVEVVALYVSLRRKLARRGLVEALTARASDSCPRAPGADAATLARRAARVLDALPGKQACLIRSLVVSRLLARRGIGSSFVLAVAPGPDFAAHAWVEHEGVPLLPPGAARYERLWQQEQAAARR